MRQDIYLVAFYRWDNKYVDHGRGFNKGVGCQSELTELMPDWKHKEKG